MSLIIDGNSATTL